MRKMWSFTELTWRKHCTSQCSRLYCLCNSLRIEIVYIVSLYWTVLVFQNMTYITQMLTMRTVVLHYMSIRINTGFGDFTWKCLACLGWSGRGICLEKSIWQSLINRLSPQRENKAGNRRDGAGVGMDVNTEVNSVCSHIIVHRYPISSLLHYWSWKSVISKPLSNVSSSSSKSLLLLFKCLYNKERDARWKHLTCTNDCVTGWWMQQNVSCLPLKNRHNTVSRSGPYSCTLFMNASAKCRLTNLSSNYCVSCLSLPFHITRSSIS